jgi:molecular chaperone GrpE
MRNAMTTSWESSEPNESGTERVEAEHTEPDSDQAQPQRTEQEEPTEPSREELWDRLRRALADIENLRKRYARELERTRAQERARVAAEWLPVIDNLELALEHAESDPRSVLEGVRTIRDQAIDVAARLGYPRQDETGVPFDPNRHEVVNVVEAPDAEPGTVVQVLRPGYGVAENQLRPVSVVVSRQPE